MSNATFDQASHVLKLISDQDYNLQQTQRLSLCLPPFLKALGDGKLGEETLRAIAEGRAKVEILKFVVDFDKLPSVPDGWTILPDSEQLPNRMKGVMEFDPAKVLLYLDESQKKGNVIEGKKLRQKLEDVPVYGAQLLDFYLANTHLIPEEWKGKYVFFWGTIYRGALGRLSVRCLCWDGTGWGWRCCWLGSDWDGDGPAARCAS
jgi:hypothetical protein